MPERRKMPLVLLMILSLAAAVSATGALAQKRKAISPLSRPIKHFRIGKTATLAALLWLGRDERVCFGIEFYGDLGETVQIDMSRTTVGEVAKKILGNEYRLSVLHGVILIRRRRGPLADWLSYRVPRFKAERGELLWVNNELWMTVESRMNPSAEGFVGDFSPTSPIDKVGPFDEKQRTVEDLLAKLVAASRGGASWFPTQDVLSPASTSINGRWTLAAYSGRWASRPQ